MNRRHFIRCSGLSLGSLLLADLHWGTQFKSKAIKLPDRIEALIGNQKVMLYKSSTTTWENKNLSVEVRRNKLSVDVSITAYHEAVSEVVLYWKTEAKHSSTILNDHWERTYGDVSWHKANSSEILPWYFMEITPKNQVNGFGVKIGAKAFCYWRILESELCLVMDVRSGGNGVLLNGRNLLAAEIVTHQSEMDAKPFYELRLFLKKMCENARMPKEPVYGINDWYFSYGNNSEKLIMEHTELLAPLAKEVNNRPFSVIDAGWFRSFKNMPGDCCFGDMSKPNNRFGDMQLLAYKINQAGMRPGIWCRPLCASINENPSLILPPIQGRNNINQPILDPSIPENLERIKSYFKLYKDWNFELVKFDFTTYDIFGKWGFEMVKDQKMTEFGWSMYDKSKTNAEIILNLYKTIREAAGEIYIIGCNTISHLSAGLFELNRIGDDTSGIEWERTLKMGVNTLAFRGAHHGIFYSADSDCVGLTNKIPWEKNKQWMDLLAKSGTPLFISAQPEATGREQRIVIKECFSLASTNLPIAEPIDWIQ
ncbi:MAG: hypothetical protein N2662_05375, partial [Bacteroidales bacterium]|nr:hypothetical protein [Bacteroidales bacterium]